MKRRRKSKKKQRNRKKKEVQQKQGSKKERRFSKRRRSGIRGGTRISHKKGDVKHNSKIPKTFSKIQRFDSFSKKGIDKR